MTVALLAAAFAIPGALIAAETQRFAPVDPKAYSPAQQEFAKLMTVAPRGAPSPMSPSRCISRARNSASSDQVSNYLRWGTGLDARLSGTCDHHRRAPMDERLHLARPLSARGQGRA